MELFKKGLPKWPALIVKGKPVTKDQAKEIIIRTDGLSFCSNDKEFEKDINEIMFGVRESWMGLTEAVEKKFNLPKHQGYGYLDAKRAEYGTLPLEYLRNKDGKVELIEPIGQIDYPTDNAMQNVMNILHNPMRERGCTIDQLKEALEYTKSKVSEKQLN